MWRAFDKLSRFIATPAVAKHRLFIWLDTRICPDHALIVIARDDDTTFGILHSRFHEAWALRLCTWLGVGNDPRYTPTTTYETYPFPKGLSGPMCPPSITLDDSRAVAIADAARRLVELRNRWLNPPEWVEWVDEPVPGYPKRPVPLDETAARGTQEAHPHQPLQHASAMARRRPHGTRRRRGRRLWLAHRHFRRRSVGGVAQDESGGRGVRSIRPTDARGFRSGSRTSGTLLGSAT